MTVGGLGPGSGVLLSVEVEEDELDEDVELPEALAVEPVLDEPDEDDEFDPLDEEEDDAPMVNVGGPDEADDEDALPDRPGFGSSSARIWRISA